MKNTGRVIALGGYDIVAVARSWEKNEVIPGNDK